MLATLPAMRKIQSRQPLLVALILVPALVTSGLLTAEEPPPSNLREALAQGTASLAFRYRLEQVDDSAGPAAPDGLAFRSPPSHNRVKG